MRTICFLERAGCAGGGKGILCSEEKTFTLSTVDNMRVCKMENIEEIKNGNEEKRYSNKVLRDLREAITEKTFEEWGLGVIIAFQQKEVLQSGLLLQKNDRNKIQPKLDDSALPCQKDNSSWILRDLRKDGCDRCSSSGWELAEQLGREFDAYLQELSYQGTSSKKILRDMWEASEGLGILREALSKIQEIWEPISLQDQPVLRCFVGQTVVRRLTPIEAERLQGFPDNYTNIPWANKPTAPDSRRYKALGNSMAVPVMRWIGKQMMEAREVVCDEAAIDRILYVTPSDDGQLSLF